MDQDTQTRRPTAPSPPRRRSAPTHVEERYVLPTSVGGRGACCGRRLGVGAYAGDAGTGRRPRAGRAGGGPDGRPAGGHPRPAPAGRPPPRRRAAGRGPRGPRRPLARAGPAHGGRHPAGRAARRATSRTSSSGRCSRWPPTRTTPSPPPWRSSRTPTPWSSTCATASAATPTPSSCSLSHVVGEDPVRLGGPRQPGRGAAPAVDPAGGAAAVRGRTGRSSCSPPRARSPAARRWPSTCGPGARPGRRGADPGRREPAGGRRRSTTSSSSPCPSPGRCSPRTGATWEGTGRRARRRVPRRGGARARARAPARRAASPDAVVVERVRELVLGEAGPDDRDGGHEDRDDARDRERRLRAR